MQMQALYKAYLNSTGVTTDTRNIKDGNIFFALKGDKFNANLFAEDALNRGAGYAVVDKIENLAWKGLYGERLILVEDALATLQQLAGYHRQQLKCPVLAITGSNGKTTTKELVAAVMSKKCKTQATKGNLNNHIGIPLTILSMPADIEFAVVEMGANHIGEIAGYCTYAAPDYGLITNVGMAHTEGFGGFEGVVQGKTELYKYVAQHGKKIFVSGNNEILLRKLEELHVSALAVTYGTGSKADCRGEIISTGEFLSLKTGELSIATNLVGDYNFENVLAAVCVGRYFGVEPNQIKEAVETYAPTNNRSQKISYGSSTVILDAYNANPSSMMHALKNFESIKAANKAVILGEMMELGDYAKREHTKVHEAVNNMQLTKRVFLGKGFEFLKHAANCLWFENTESLKAWFRQQAWDNYYLLIKGSRSNELEKILKD
jgi:UDP-N-acetylmuramoyl-tripeptide--D-alanyl-D-alanine ligase